MSGPDLGVVGADQARALGDEENAAGGAVVDRLRDLGGDLPGQVGSDAGHQRGRDDRTGLQQERARGRRDTIAADHPAVDGGVEEGLPSVRCGLFRGWLKAFHVREGRRLGRKPGGSCGLSGAGRLCEELARARRLDLGEAALLLGIEGLDGLDRRRRDRLAAFLGAQDRPSEIAGQGWSEGGDLARDVGIVPREAREFVRGRRIVGAVKLGRRAPLAALQRDDQHSADGQGHEGRTGAEHPARQAHDSRWVGPQPHLGSDLLPDGIRSVFRSRGHNLPPVRWSRVGGAGEAAACWRRTIRTTCCARPVPSRSSAAAKSRSMIITLRWTRLFTSSGAPSGPSTKSGGISPCTIPRGNSI